MSPRTIIALTAEPGRSGSGCFSLLEAPTPITGVIPAAARLGANCFNADSLNPLKTKGASIGCRYWAKLWIGLLSAPGVLVLVAPTSLAEVVVPPWGML